MCSANLDIYNANYPVVKNAYIISSQLQQLILFSHLSSSENVTLILVFQLFLQSCGRILRCGNRCIKTDLFVNATRTMQLRIRSFIKDRTISTLFTCEWLFRPPDCFLLFKGVLRNLRFSAWQDTRLTPLYFY